MNLNDCSNYDRVLKSAKLYYGNDVVGGRQKYPNA